MAHAAVAFAKASFRRRMMACTTSIGPGATNLVTAAAVAHVNRLPLLLLAGRRLRQSAARPGAAADRGFRRRPRLGERRVAPGVALFRPADAAGAAHPGGAAHDDRADRSCRMRARHLGALPGRADRGLRLSGKLLREARLDLAPARSRCARARCSGRASAPGEEAADHRGRRRALFASLRDALALRRAPRDSGRRDAGRQVGASRRPCLEPWARSASPAPRRRTRSPPRPISSSASARASRISPPDPGRSFKIRSAASCRSMSQAQDAAKHGAAPLVADARVGLEALGGALGDHAAPARWTQCRRARISSIGRRPRRRRSNAPRGNELPSDAQVIGAVHARARPRSDARLRRGRACRANCTNSGKPARPAATTGIRLFLHGL